MLVAGVDQPSLLVIRHRRRPVHVGVAHQREYCVDTLGGEGLGQDVGYLAVAHFVSLPENFSRTHDAAARDRILPPLSSEDRGATLPPGARSSVGAAVS